MFFLNFTAGEFFALLGVLGGLVTLLYLLDRAKRKKTVSTLRFWTPGAIAEQQQNRRRMREPWSLVLQLLSLLLLLLALGQLQWGSRERRGRDHVLLLDTSAWSAEDAGKGSLLDLEKQKAQQFIHALPASDRVLLIRAGALTTPVTSFTSDRARLSTVLAESQPDYGSFNAEQALAYAQEAQTWSGGRRGEIVYIGPRMVDRQEVSTPPMDNLRVITVASRNENCGIRALAVKRGADEEHTWQAFVTIHNYSADSRAVQLRTQFAGTAFAPRGVLLKPGEERVLEYNFMTNVTGELTARLTPEDNLLSDNTASLYLPRNHPLRIAAFTTRPDILKTVLSANHRLSLAISDPGKYQPGPDADVMVLDQFSPSAAPLIPSLWIQPSAAHSPLPVKSTINELSVKTWNSEGDLTSGLRTHELPASTAEVFQTFEGDTAVASAAEGPIVVVRPARQGRPQMAVVGFDPLAGQLKFEVTTPLLFANLLRWLSPALFRNGKSSPGTWGQHHSHWTQGNKEISSI